ncbi:MAG: glycerol-3-phosphate 1-O-acyltransferase PlsY [Clostridia bacterium]|nr:glycerol-3-phosphate 1-O-acyltransferase PlsY [Clostridia bacterium]
MTTTQYVICALFGYLLGGFSTAITLSVFFENEDIRTVGSGNAGATNMLRNYGWKAGLLTFGCDVLKGFVSTWVGLWAFGETAAVICGVCAVIGHIFPIYYGFKGGKGISASVGMMLMLAPVPMLVVVVLMGILVYATKIVSIGSIVGNILMLIAIWAFRSHDLVLCIGATIVVLLNLYSHRENIVRLFKRSENKMNWKELSAHSRVELRFKKKDK